MNANKWNHIEKHPTEKGFYFVWMFRKRNDGKIDGRVKRGFVRIAYYFGDLDNCLINWKIFETDLLDIEKLKVFYWKKIDIPEQPIERIKTI